MTDSRRYNEDDVREIFSAAAAPRAGRLSPGQGAGGLTLAELQEIGREAGISPDRIAEAAAALGSVQVQDPRGHQLGMPISVGHAVELPRALSDREWDILVADLRKTFGAVGKVVVDGETRVWRNGNLHAIVEPTEHGFRLRLSTRKSDASSVNLVGFSLLLMAMIVLVGLMTKDRADDILVPLVMAVVGITAFGYNAVRLPRWAGEREEQMRYIAGRAVALLEADPPVNRLAGSADPPPSRSESEPRPER